MKLDQKLGLQRRTASIGADGVDVTYVDPVAMERWKVPFEELIREPVEFLQQPERMSTTRTVVLGLGLYFAFTTLTGPDVDRTWGLVSAALCLGSVALAALLDRLPRRRLLQLSSGSAPLLVFADRPSREAVAEFRKALFEASDAYLGARYPNEAAGPSLVDQLERLYALHKSGALSAEEYERLKARITGAIAYESSGQYL
ncbi:MAG: SHOCT domain-containing protein [Spirochaetaceae bacterium]|nr:SHOCT domain-containing protein [Myxococcales bacterium]MCB9724380.1 SHOCT domain-containing protein [Spirochaetaceae bacterium]HPG26081.1 SHOCT domain-containing protein [Myxococcota bacterium]